MEAIFVRKEFQNMNTNCRTKEGSLVITWGIYAWLGLQGIMPWIIISFVRNKSLSNNGTSKLGICIWRSEECLCLPKIFLISEKLSISWDLRWGESKASSKMIDDHFLSASSSCSRFYIFVFSLVLVLVPRFSQICIILCFFRHKLMPLQA